MTAEGDRFRWPLPCAVRLGRTAYGVGPRVPKTKEVGIAVLPGDVFEVRSGGGGWGPPAAREAAARERDVQEDLVSGEGARPVSRLRIGIDVGDTFTDLVAIDAAGTTSFAKRPSTPADQSIGVMAGLEELAGQLGQSLGAIADKAI